MGPGRAGWFHQPARNHRQRGTNRGRCGLRLRLTRSYEADRFNTLFQSNLTQIPANIANFGVLDLGQLSNRYADYLIVRTTAGTTTGYLVQFIVGNDGIWRIDEM